LQYERLIEKSLIRKGGALITSADIAEQLANTQGVLSTIHHFQCTPVCLPGKSSRGAAINYSDLVERRSDFVRELKSSICNWVYSKAKFRSILQAELAVRGDDFANAASHVIDLARAKFRRGYPQGQFGELLLFNFLEHFFKAPPLLRKMPITTNPAIERHGADAIHVGLETGNPVIYLGEAKTYESTYQFNTALRAAVTSILDSHSKLQSELDLYVYDDFIEAPFKELAEQIKRNAIAYQIELVSIVSYEETKKVQGPNEQQIKKRIESIIADRIGAIDTSLFSDLNPHIVSRMHFFLLPFWKLDELLVEFDS
jgi:hypothetical protein